MATATFTGNTQSGSPYWGGYFRVDLSESNQDNVADTSRVNWAAYFYFGSGYSTLQNGHLAINGVTVWNAPGVYHIYNSADLGQTVFLASGFIDITHNPDGTKTVNVNGGTSLYNSDSYQSNFNNNFTLDTLNVLPGAPTSLSATGYNDSDPTSVGLSWLAPSNVGSGLTQYEVQVSTNNSFSSPVVDHAATWATSYAVSLSYNTTYYVRVRASTSGGWGAWSSTISFVTGTTTPSAPGTPTTSAVSYTSMTVSWTAPTSDGGSAITSYTLERATNSGFTAGLTTVTGIGGTSYNVTGLAAGTTYYFRVKALNANGASSASGTKTQATIAATAPAAPGQPTFPVVGGTSLTVSWTAPDGSSTWNIISNGAIITSYRVEYSTSSGFATFASITGITSLSTQVTGLAYGQTYYFRVKAVSSAGTSVASTSNSVTTTTTTPDAPSSAPTISGITQTTAAVTYTAPAGDGGTAITGYDIARATDSAFTQSVVIAQDDVSPYTLTNLSPATTYWVRYRAKNANGAGGWSSAVSFQAAPPAFLWNGASWVPGQVFAWNGATWVPATTSKWSGSAWV